MLQYAFGRMELYSGASLINNHSSFTFILHHPFLYPRCDIDRICTNYVEPILRLAHLVSVQSCQMDAIESQTTCWSCQWQTKPEFEHLSWESNPYCLSWIWLTTLTGVTSKEHAQITLNLSGYGVEIGVKCTRPKEQLGMVTDTITASSKSEQVGIYLRQLLI